MKPPYSVTDTILQLVASISEKIGAINATHLDRPPAELRKSNRIKTIQASLEIEGNTLSIEQITALLNNKRILGPQKDILEVQNAIVVYDNLLDFNPYSLKDLLQAHQLLMKGLIDTAGKLRTKSVGIVKGSKVTHVAPGGGMVKSLMTDLLKYLKTSKDLTLIKSCVFHYELEFIHPFMDGNGRIGRLWQTLILMQQYPVFEYLPIETIVKRRQKEYYEALSKSDKSGSSTIFIEFMLGVILEGLEEVLQSQNTSLSVSDRINLFKLHFGKQEFTRKDYLQHFKEISQATASRDLKEAVTNGYLKKMGDKNKTSYKFL